MASDRQIPTSASTPPITGLVFMNAVQEELTALFNAVRLPLGTVAGTANAITAVCVPVLTGALQDGMGFSIRIVTTNTASATIAIDGTTPVDLVDLNGVALRAGMLKAGSVYDLIYNAATGDIYVLNANTVIGTHTKYIRGDQLVTRTTLGAVAGTVETTTNKVMLKTMDFNATAASYAQFSFIAPKNWDEGTVTARFIWAHPVTTVNYGVRWNIQGVALSDDDAGDTAFGTAIAVTDTGGTTTDIYQSAVTGAITVGGTPAEGDLLVFQIYRDPTHVDDTLAVNATLIGVVLYFTTNAANET